ncbi:hypothetical protein AN932_16045, partial [Mycobacterium intracellulare subsp. chimaera]
LPRAAPCFIPFFPQGGRAAPLPRGTSPHTGTAVPPAQRNRGVGEAQTPTLRVDTPRRYFEIA